MNKKNKGFTLVELLVVIGILGILMGALFPAISSAMIKANLSACGMRGRNLFVAITAANTEREALGLGNVWPKTQDEEGADKSKDPLSGGVSSAADYFTYTYNLFDDTATLPITDFSTGYAYQFNCFATTGLLENTNKTVNRGLEFDFDLGEIPMLKTNLYFSGAWNETKTDWSTRMNTTGVPASLLSGTIYAGRNISPIRIVYPSGLDYTRLRRFVNTLRAVTHIPQLHMVASFTAQVIWHNSTWSYTADKDPIGWIDNNLVYHDINSSATIDFPGGSFAANDEKLQLRYTDNEPNKSPTTWNLSARLTKELGKVGGLSLYVDNCLFYEPYMKGNNTNTLTQRNTGKFAFGAELSLNL